MIHKVYAIKDDKVEAFQTPFLSPARGHALRMFMDATNDPKTQFYAHPEDFALYEMGEFDDTTGVYTQKLSVKSDGSTVVEPFLVATAEDVIKKQEVK